MCVVWDVYVFPPLCLSCMSRRCIFISGWCRYEILTQCFYNLISDILVLAMSVMYLKNVCVYIPQSLLCLSYVKKVYVYIP